ncbi:zf-CCHC domain-containing protein [Tanacetum coccineum]
MISKNDEAKMVLYNALPKKEYERIFMYNMAKDVLELTNNHSSRFNTIITSLKALDESFSSRNHVRKFLRALLTKWRPKVTTIEESKDLSTLPLDELNGNLKVYEVVLEKDSEISKSKKEKYKSLALKARKVSSDEEISCSESDDEEYVMVVRDFKKFFRRRGEFVRQDHDDKKNFRKIKEDIKEKEDQSEEDSKKEEIYLMALDSNEVLSDTPYYSSSSLDSESLQNECKEHGKLLVDSVLNGPFQYGTIVEPGNETTPATTIQQPSQPSFSELDSGLVVPPFNPSDDPIAILNKALAFLSTTFSSCFPQINNQLRTSSNPRNQATIQDRRVTDPIQYMGTNTPCTKPKRPKNSAWFKENILLIKALKSGDYLDSEQLAFLADNGDATDDLDDFDSDYDDVPSAKAVLMANLSSYDSNVISEIYMVKFLRSKDEAPEFVNQTLKEYNENVRISHQSSIAHTLQQNGVVERQNHTLVEVAHTMLIFSKASLYFEDFGKLKPKADIDAPSTSNLSTQEQEQSPIISQGVEESPKTQHFHNDPLYETLHKDSTSQGSSSNVRSSHTPLELLGK